MYIFSKLLPFYSRKIEELSIYTDIKTDPKKFSGLMVLIGIILGLVALALGIIFGLIWYLAILLLIFIFSLVLATAYFILILKADARAKEIETYLPDALQLMSTNLRAGLTTDKALLISAREEFGALNIELKRVGKEVAIGKDIREALLNMTRRVKSHVLNRTINLIVFGITSGGELSSLLEETALSLRQQSLTKKQIHSAVLMYSIFIFIAVGFISPLLFSLSSTLVGIMTKSLATVELPSASAINMPFVFSKIQMEEKFVIFFSLGILIISSILSSLVLGLINSGEEKDGIKYIPILISISLSVFFIVRFLIGKLIVSFVS